MRLEGTFGRALRDFEKKTEIEWQQLVADYNKAVTMGLDVTLPSEEEKREWVTKATEKMYTPRINWNCPPQSRQCSAVRIAQ